MGRSSNDPIPVTLPWKKQAVLSGVIPKSKIAAPGAGTSEGGM